MSRCAHGPSPANRWRKSAAIVAPPRLETGVFLRSAIGRVQVVLVGGVERHEPGVIAARLRGRLHPLEPGVVVAEEARVEVSERDLDRPGQGGEVEEVRRALGAGVQERVGQDEAALRVGVVDLDGRPVGRADDVARPGRVAREHVLGRGDDDQHAQGQLELGDRAEGGERRRGPAHVRLHVLLGGGGLQRVAARVERDPLADDPEDELRVGGRLRLVAQRDEARRVVAPRGDRDERAHAGGLHLLGAHDVGGDAGEPLLDLTGDLGQAERGERVRRRVHEIARAVRPPCDERSSLCAVERVGRARAAEDERLERRRLLRLGLPAPGVVAAEHQPVDDRAGLLRRVEPPGDRARAPVGDGRRRRAQRIRVGGLAQAGDRQPLRLQLSVQMKGRELAALSGQLAVGEQPLEAAADAGVEALQVSQLERLRDREHEDVGFDVFEGAAADGDVHGRRMLAEAPNESFPLKPGRSRADRGEAH